MSSTGDPQWYDIVDPDVSHLSDEGVARYVRHWSDRREAYRQQARDGAPEPASAAGGQCSPSYSAWWAGKILDKGLRERERRIYRAELAGQADDPATARTGEPPG